MRDSITSLSAVRIDLHQLIGAIRHTEESERQQERERQREKHDIADRILAAERDIHKYEQREERTYRKLNLWIQLALAASTALAFIAAAIYGAFAYGQWKTLEGSYEQMQIQSGAAIQAANTASDALKHSDEQERLSYRASISPTSWDPVTFADGQPIIVPVKIKNSGKTIARHVEGNIAIYPIGRNETPQFVYTPGHANYKIETGAMFPEMPITMNFAALVHGKKKARIIILDKPMHDSLTRGDILIVAHGRIAYQDIFGVDHWVQFCVLATGQQAEAGSVPECMRYNDADNNK